MVGLVLLVNAIEPIERWTYVGVQQRILSAIGLGKEY